VNINIENCLKNELPPRLRWLGDKLTVHLKDLRNRCATDVPTNAMEAIDEFFDHYRFSDNQCSDDWRDVK